MNFLTPRAQSFPAGVKGRGVFAIDPIASGHTVAGFGGYMVSADEFNALPARRMMHSIQMTDDLYLVGPDETEDADLVNHSCEPNCGLMGATILVAMRDIASALSIPLFTAYSRLRKARKELEAAVHHIQQRVVR